MQPGWCRDPNPFPASQRDPRRCRQRYHMIQAPRPASSAAASTLFEPPYVSAASTRLLLKAVFAGAPRREHVTHSLKLNPRPQRETGTNVAAFAPLLREELQEGVSREGLVRKAR
ncbi:hypothetical protein DPSP01_010039 [Paraphaeosphaeria sporulosa]